MTEQKGELLLSSYGFASPIMREKYAKVLEGKDLKNQVCAVLPYTAKNPERVFESEKRGLVEFGFDPNGVIMIRSRHDLVRRVPDYPYVPGGDPFLLLRTVRELGIVRDLARCVREEGTVYVGVSAGADLATENIEYVRRLESDEHLSSGNCDALGLLADNVLCHADARDDGTKIACKVAGGKPMIYIRNDQLVHVLDGRWEYAGEEE